jgi:hypothetical protein
MMTAFVSHLGPEGTYLAGITFSFRFREHTNRRNDSTIAWRYQEPAAVPAAERDACLRLLFCTLIALDSLPLCRLLALLQQAEGLLRSGIELRCRRRQNIAPIPTTDRNSQLGARAIPLSSLVRRLDRRRRSGQKNPDQERAG